jgi:translation elongation factor EF-Tu-like GTPase
MHPELSRAGGPAIYYSAAFAAYAGVPVILAAANFAVIEAAPQEKKRGLTLMFSSALTGTFGGDYSTLV